VLALAAYGCGGGDITIGDGGGGDGNPNNDSGNNGDGGGNPDSGDPDSGSNADSGSNTDGSTGNDGGTDGGGWTVNQVPGIALWLDGTKGVTQMNGRISKWDDQSGNSNHAVQNVAGRQPATLAQGINNQPCVHFDNSQQIGQMMIVPDAATLQFGTGDYLVEVVARYDNSLQANPYWVRGFADFYGKATINFQNNPPTVSTGLLFFGNGIGNNQLASVIFGRTDPQHSVATSLFGYNNNVGRNYATQRTGTTMTVRVNGVVGGTNAPMGTVDVSQPNVPVQIGAMADASFARMNGDICEVIAVKGSVSAGDLSNIEAYLKAKYGL
jgi:hypothetical protein